MRGAVTFGIIGVVSILLLLSLPTPPGSVGPPSSAIPHPSAPEIQTAFDTALHEAQMGWLKAKAKAKQRMEERDAATPMSGEADAEALRRTLMIADPVGDIHHALAAARRASSLARTPAEARRAATLRVMLECNTGHHREELRQAKRLAALERGSRHSLPVLLRAARCNEETALAERTTAALDALAEPR